MAEKPTPGGSDGTYGTELNAFLDVSLDDDGKINDGAAQTTSAAPSADAELANKLYVDNGGERSVGGTPTVVHTKYFTGTTDNDNQTNVAHGIADFNKILSFTGSISNGSEYIASDYRFSVGTTDVFVLSLASSAVLFTNVGTNFRLKNYRVKIDYID